MIRGGMIHSLEQLSNLHALPEPQRNRSTGPTPIWHSKLYQQRRVYEIASRIRQDRMKRFEDGTYLREKRAFADHLLTLCDKAQRILQRQGGDIADDLERIDDLEFIVGVLDAEGSNTDLEGMLELRNHLEAMVLAIEVARVAARD